MYWKTAIITTENCSNNRLTRKNLRHLNPDLEGAYSWWSYRFHAREKNAGWRIDYFIVSNRLADKIKSAAIHNEIYGSDHCPVELVL